MTPKKVKEAYDKMHEYFKRKAKEQLDYYLAKDG